MFESEFDRLKDYFLLEGKEDSKPSDNYDDLEEGTNEDESGEEKPDDTEEPAKDEDKPEDSDDGKEKSADDSNLDGDDSSLDSDLDDILGEEEEPSAEEVNKQPAQPGAVDPKQMLSEMASGNDNVYTRVVQSAKNHFPGQKVPNKALLRITSTTVKEFMKNKNYTMNKDAFKAVCLNIVKTIIGNAKKAASAKQSNMVNQQPRQQQQKPAQESVRYYTRTPMYETADWIEQWNRMAPALEEGKLGNLAAAGALALAGAAHSATAPSAPESTLLGTPRYTANVVQQDGQNLQKQNKAAAVQQKGRAVANTPSTGNPASVHFSPDSTYQMSPDDYVKFKQANNLPPHYTVSGDSDHQPVDTGKASVQDGGKPSASQAAVKKQAKTGKTTQQIATGKAQSDNGKCQMSPEDQKGSIDVGETVHKLGHEAIDTAYKGGSAVFHGAVDGAKGLWNGLKKGWNNASKGIERDHDKMIAERNK